MLGADVQRRVVPAVSRPPSPSQCQLLRLKGAISLFRGVHRPTHDLTFNAFAKALLIQFGWVQTPA